MVQESSTFDETHYFGLGKYLLQTGRWDVPSSILHPPLSYYLHSIPLLFVSTDDTLWKQNPEWQRKPHYRTIFDIERGRAILSSPANDGDRLLTLARLMMVLVALLLGWYVFSWSFALYGNSGAIIAVVLYSFCPNILAHARLITPDIALTTFFFATVYYFWRMLREDRLSVAIVAGIALGLALLSKYTAVLLVPLCVVLALLWFFQTKSLPWRGCLIFVAVGLAVFLLGYRGNLEPYFAGLQFQREYASRPQWVFLCGECLPCRWGCYFYTISFLLKTPIAAMIGLVLAMVVFVKKAVRGQWISETFLLAPAFTIFALFAVHAQCLGLRYILPMYPFLFVFIAGGIAYLLSRKIMAILCGGLALWYLGASVYIHPHYLVYFNELVGGPDNGYKYLVDSDLDWGQDLKGLGRYMREHHIPKVRLSYFGLDSPQRYGVAYELLSGYALKEPPRAQTEATETTAADYVAISATDLQGVYLPDIDMFAALRNREPVAKIGYSIFIYPNVDIDLDDSGRLDEAIAHYRKALEIRPDFTEAHYSLGLILARRGQFDEAIAQYRKALEIRPDFTDARNNLGLILARRGQSDEAIAQYQKALEINPNDMQAHGNLGAALAENGRLDEAIAHFQAVLAIKPDFELGHYNLGKALTKYGRLDEAIVEYQKALEINPNHAETLNEFGLALVQCGRLNEAITQYEKAVKIRPDYAEALDNLGNALAGCGRTEEAIASYRKAVEVNPDYAEAYSNLGLALAGRGRVEEAIANYRKALESKPDAAAVHNNLGLALAGRGEIDEALGHYRQALAVEPKYAEAHNNLANALANRGEIDEAMVHYRKALEAKPDYAGARRNLEIVQSRWEEIRKALAGRRELLRSRPDDITLLNDTAWMLATNPNASIRNGPEAVELAQRAVQLSDGREPIVLGTLAAAYAEAGRFPEAVQTAQGPGSGHRAEQAALRGIDPGQDAPLRSGKPFPRDAAVRSSRFRPASRGFHATLAARSGLLASKSPNHDNRSQSAGGVSGITVGKISNEARCGNARRLLVPCRSVMRNSMGSHRRRSATAR